MSLIIESYTSRKEIRFSKILPSFVVYELFPLFFRLGKLYGNPAKKVTPKKRWKVILGSGSSSKSSQKHFFLHGRVIGWMLFFFVSPSLLSHHFIRSDSNPVFRKQIREMFNIKLNKYFLLFLMIWNTFQWHSERFSPNFDPKIGILRDVNRHLFKKKCCQFVAFYSFLAIAVRI